MDKNQFRYIEKGGSKMKLVKIFKSTGNVYCGWCADGEVSETVDVDVKGLTSEIDNWGMDHFALDGVPVTSMTEVDGKIKVIAQYPFSDNAIVRFGKER